jgi:hypothetical protein
MIHQYMSVFAWLISHQPAVLSSQNKSATTNQPAVLFFQNEPVPTISHQLHDMDMDGLGMDRWRWSVFKLMNTVYSPQI